MNTRNIPSVQGASTRKVEELLQSLGIEKLSKSQVSKFAKELDGAVRMEMHDDWAVLRRCLAQVNNTPQQVPVLEAVHPKPLKKAG